MAGYAWSNTRDMRRVLSTVSTRRAVTFATLFWVAVGLPSRGQGTQRTADSADPSVQGPTRSAQATQVGPSSSSPARKIELVEPWKDGTIKLVVPGSTKGPASKSRTIEVRGKRAVYEGVGQKIIGAAGSGKVWILCIHDPYTKRICFMDGDHTFCVSDPSGMTGYDVGPGDIIFSHSYLRTA